MTSTPVSLNDESLNGSWIDVNSASQVPSPMMGDDDASHEMLRSSAAGGSAAADPKQSFGLMSFQVERFLQQEAAEPNNNTNQPSNSINQAEPAVGPPNEADNQSELYLSDTDISIDGCLDTIALIKTLRKHHKHKTAAGESDFNQQPFETTSNTLAGTNRDLFRQSHLFGALGQRLSKSGDCLMDQLSDSLSLLSRASARDRDPNDFQDFDWLWDWTAQPEYFAGKEWKMTAPKQEYLMRQRQMNFASQMQEGNSNHLFSGEVISLLFITNILSIIIGAGITYSIIMRKSSI